MVDDFRRMNTGTSPTQGIALTWECLSYVYTLSNAKLVTSAAGARPPVTARQSDFQLLTKTQLATVHMTAALYQKTNATTHVLEYFHRVLHYNKGIHKDAM
jgi:hypothetical protein